MLGLADLLRKASRRHRHASEKQLWAVEFTPSNIHRAFPGSFLWGSCLRDIRNYRFGSFAGYRTVLLMSFWSTLELHWMIGDSNSGGMFLVRLIEWCWNRSLIRRTRRDRIGVPKWKFPSIQFNSILESSWSIDQPESIPLEKSEFSSISSRFARELWCHLNLEICRRIAVQNFRISDIIVS